MRSMEQYLPNPNQTRQYADGKGKQIRTYELFSRDYRVATLSKLYLNVTWIIIKSFKLIEQP